MSVRRFVTYFLAVSACSTVAFASTLMGAPPAAPAQAADAADSLRAAHHPGHHAISFRHARFVVKATLMARAD